MKNGRRHFALTSWLPLNSHKLTGSLHAIASGKHVDNIGVKRREPGFTFLCTKASYWPSPATTDTSDRYDVTIGCLTRSQRYTNLRRMFAALLFHDGLRHRVTNKYAIPLSTRLVLQCLWIESAAGLGTGKNWEPMFAITICSRITPVAAIVAGGRTHPSAAQELGHTKETFSAASSMLHIAEGIGWAGKLCAIRCLS